MPQPKSPVIPGADLPEVVYAKHQPEYLQLPAHLMPDGTVLTRWKFSFLERLRLLFTGNLYVWLLTFNQPLQPIAISTEKPGVEKPQVQEAAA